MEGREERRGPSLFDRETILPISKNLKFIFYVIPKLPDCNRPATFPQPLYFFQQFSLGYDPFSLKQIYQRLLSIDIAQKNLFKADHLFGVEFFFPYSHFAL
jgi:hypothetical protein